ncbi:MAG: hypothetical protein ACOCR1_01445 [Planctomycetota bacterium]
MCGWRRGADRPDLGEFSQMRVGSVDRRPSSPAPRRCDQLVQCS